MFKWLNAVVHTTTSIKKIKFKSRLKIQSHLKTLHHTEWLPSCCKQKILLAMWMDMAYGHVHDRYHFSEGNDDDLIR